MTVAPTPTVSSAAKGYIPRGKRRYLFMTTCLNPQAPTASEMSAGTDITKMVMGYNGFTGSSSLVEYGNAFTRFKGKIPGPIDADDSALMLNLDKGGSDARTMFVDGVDGTTDPTSGFIVISYEGYVTGGNYRNFPVTVSTVKPSDDLDAPATIEVDFGITDQPSPLLKYTAT